MKKRIETLKRVGRLHTRLHELKRARLAAIDQEQASLADQSRAVFEALMTGAVAYGAQARLSARHVRGIEKRIEALSQEREEARVKALAYGLRARLADQAAYSVLARYRESERRRDLVDVVERALGRRPESPTQG